MHFSTFVAALASSAALVSALPSPPIEVTVDDVILYGKSGRFQVVKRSEYDEIQKARSSGTVPPAPSHLDPKFQNSDAAFSIGNNVTVPETQAEGVEKRFSTSTIIIPDPHQRFLGWDVQMSPVLKGKATIAVATGYMLANSITTGVSAAFPPILEFLSATVSVDYSTTWTTTQTQTFTGEVPADNYGAFVSNPWTNRESGHVFIGVIGSEGTWSSYQADSFETKAYGSLEWVDGAISLCSGPEFPLKRCIGEGTL